MHQCGSHFILLSHTCGHYVNLTFTVTFSVLKLFGLTFQKLFNGTYKTATTWNVMVIIFDKLILLYSTWV